MADALTEPLVLIDVGCSGGIATPWDVFGDKIKAYGFDPAVAEIERLAKVETRPEVHYRAAFVAAPADHPVAQPQPGPPFSWRDPNARLAWPRTRGLHDAAESGAASPPFMTPFPLPPTTTPGDVSAPFRLDYGVPDEPASASQSGRDAALMADNQWHRARLADPSRPVYLAQLIADEGLRSIDFIKIDCDGPDFEILASLQDVLRDTQVLAVCAEVNFIGGAASNHHTFHNTDRFMRQAGFDLMDLSVRRYASSALPFVYAHRYPHYGPNMGGRPYQGDALYARDFGWPDTALTQAQYSDDKLLKLAAVLALFGRLDQSAEVLQMFRGRLDRVLDVGRVLDLLAEEIQALQGPAFAAPDPGFSYADYMAAFESDDPSVYSGDARKADALADLRYRAEQADSAKARCAELTEEMNRRAQQTEAVIADDRAALADLLQRAESAEAQLEQLRTDLSVAMAEAMALRQSTSWRVTAPMRALRRRP